MPGAPVAPRVFLRIRPAATEGGHAQTGYPSDAKMLQGWDDKSVTIGWTCNGDDDMGKAVEAGEKYDYCEKVLRPEITQTDMYTSVVPPIIDKLLGFRQGDSTVPTGKPIDTMLFAYGQTGTGKTFTTLGPDGSLRTAPADGSTDARWGCFPRAVYEIFDRLRGAARPFTVSMSAVEFYLGQANDLLLVNNPVALSIDHEILGLMQATLHNPSDVIPILARARAARHTRHTRMNLAKTSTKRKANGTPQDPEPSVADASEPGDSDDDEHSGSSRGHALFIITVRQFDAESGHVMQSAFRLVDLAGAERPDKTGAKRVNGIEAFAEMMNYINAQKKGDPAEMSMGAQAFFINYELSCIAQTALEATEYFRQHRAKPNAPAYKPNAFLTSDVVRTLARSFGGVAHLTVIVTLSQAPQCGWETWFSCKYGRDLAKIRTPLRPNKGVSLKKELARQLTKMKENQQALTRPIHNKVIKWKRLGAITDAKATLVILRALAEQDPGAAGLDIHDRKVFDLPTAVTTGFKFPDSAIQSQYELRGEWDTTSLEGFLFEEGMTGTPEMAREFIKTPIKVQRKMIDQIEDSVEFCPENMRWLELSPETTPPVVVDTTAYPPCDNKKVSVFVHYPPTDGRPAGESQRPAMVYAHGGGGIYCKARHARTYAARVAAAHGIIVFNVEYRLAPEHPAPAAIFDTVGVVLYIRDQATELGVDPERIGVMGDSAGGWVAAGVAMELSRRQLSNALRLCVPACPMVSNIILRDPECPRVEGGPAGPVHWKWTQEQIVPSGKNIDLSYLWVANAKPSVFANFPKTAIITAEFDICRRMSEELGAKLHQAGRLVDFVVHPGGNHCWYAFMSHPKCEMYWNDLGAILTTHLIGK